MKKYKITGLHEDDAFASDRRKIVGRIVNVDVYKEWSKKQNRRVAGYYCGEVKFLNPIKLNVKTFTTIYFYAVKLEKVKRK